MWLILYKVIYGTQFLSVQQLYNSSTTAAAADMVTGHCFKDKVMRPGSYKDCPGSYKDRGVERIPGRASPNHHSYVQQIAAGGPTSTVSAACHHHTNRQNTGFGLLRRQKLPANIKFDLHAEIRRAIGLQTGHVFPGREQFDTKAPIRLPCTALD